MKYCYCVCGKNIGKNIKEQMACRQGTFVHKEFQVRVLKSEQRIKVVRTLLAAYDIALHKEEDKITPFFSSLLPHKDNHQIALHIILMIHATHVSWADASIHKLCQWIISVQSSEDKNMGTNQSKALLLNHYL